MNRAIFFLFSIAALLMFSTSASAQTCANPVTAANGAADINADGCVDAADDDAMTAAMQNGDPAGDLDGSGTVTVTDWNLYQQARKS